MFGVLRRLARQVAAFVRRLVVDAPQNEYERIVFSALYSAGVQLKKGIAG